MSKKYPEDKNSIKIWPLLNDISQAIVPYSDSTLNENKIINLDFSNIKRINSTGANITIAKLVELLKRNKSYKFRIIKPNESEIELFLQNSGCYSILKTCLNLEIANLFETIEINQNLKPIITFDKTQNSKQTSFPIFHLKYDPNNDRACVEEFSNWIEDVLIEYTFKYNYQYNILSKLLCEIAKNSQDHTADDAYFGIDIIENLSNNTVEILFSFFDLGVGILQNVRSFLKTGNHNYEKNKWQHLGIVDAYHLAFSIGFTTSEKKRNKGIGMTMIMDCANKLNLELTIFDGRSMGFIPPINTHIEIRKNFWNTTNKVGFNYYGKLKF